MIIDAGLLDTLQPLRARFCVIGSGMGGSAVATALSAAGEDVLLIEAGGLERDGGDSAAVAAEHAGRSFKMPLTRCIELGGTSNQWHGICAPLDEIDFERRSWIPQSGWPIRRADLDEAYDEAALMLELKDPGRFSPKGLPPEARRRLADVDFDPRILEHKLVQFRKPPVRWKDRLTAWARTDRHRLLIHAPALELTLRDDGASVQSLVVGSGARRLAVIADVFIVCAGALETPRLLLNSRSLAADGIGNDHGLVGRYLLDHPVGHFSKLRFHRPTKAPAYASTPLGDDVGFTAGLRLTREQQRALGLPNHYVWIRPSVSPRRIHDELLLSFLGARGARDLTPRQIWAILTNRDILYRVLVHRFGARPTFRYGDLFFMTEQLPNADSRVTLSPTGRDRHGYPVARIDWQLSTDDIRSFQRYGELLLDEGLQSGQYSVARRDDPEIWDRTLASAAHHLGTARMGADARTGVVDSNLKVFGTSNLFVCDGSVFATAGSVNPSLTITALALRLARHLVGQRQSLLARAS
jgi:choline dehydrogenase-like flavoprotein